MLLGHLVGDYLLQNEYLALNKSKSTLVGWLSATIHCLLYTLAVCTFMWNFDLNWMLIVYLTHFPIDKFALAEKYMHYIKGKGMRDYVLKDSGKSTEKTWAKPDLNRYDILEGGFTSLVYTATDNTLHLVLMYLAYITIY
jgi:hypothetical protein